MRLTYEVVEKKQQILIVDKEITALGNALKSELKKYDAEIYISPEILKDTNRFDYIFVINGNYSPQVFKKNSEQIFILIQIAKKKLAQQYSSLIAQNKLSNIKVINIGSDTDKTNYLEKILWFSFSKSKEIFLHMETFSSYGKKKEKSFFESRLKKFFSKKKILVFLISFIIVFHLSMIPFLAISSFLVFKSANSLKENQTERAEKLLKSSKVSLKIAQNLYRIVRQTYLFLSIALVPDNIIDLDNKAINILNKSIALAENSKQISKLIFKKDKTKEEKLSLLTRLDKLQKDIDQVDDELIIIGQKLPESTKGFKKLKADVIDALDLMSKGKSILPHLEKILAKDGEKKYLLLFANNMELRPGGGFIGSFGILKVKDLTVEDISIFDVYDADGQLLTHVEPPQPIREYLNQPNWFLRDSAFSSDFYENYTQAKFFLDKELGYSNFEGAILLTTTAIQNLLEAFGTLYLSGFSETITKDNFYIKAQIYSEKNFFPGSIQKKNFLGSIARQILINLDSVSPPLLIKSLKKSLDEKQMVLYFDDLAIQSSLDDLYWSGKTIIPRCVSENKNCIVDYMFPVDANLGVNKANFFVSRSFSAKVNIDKEGIISKTFSVDIKNESPNNIFPGGTYKNYFQLFLPQNSKIKKITKNDVLVEAYNERETEFKTVGFLVEISPQKEAEIKVEYQLPQILRQGKGIYQLVFQKQTGSKNSDLNLEINLPFNISVINQNFSPLVKGNRISYNTSLSADKIFFIEMVRE